MMRNRALLTLWGGEFSARIGESMFQIALLWYLLEVTGSSVATGVVSMISYLPAILVGLWSGVIVDRRPYRQVLLQANAARLLLVLALPLLFAWRGLPVWGVAGLAFLISSAAAFFGPARDALIPRLAARGELLAANSLVQSAWQFSLLIGPFLAAAALPFMPTIDLFFLVAGAFALSLGVLLGLPRTPAAGAHAQAGPDVTRVVAAPEFGGAFWADFSEGLGYLWRERRVFWIWVVTVANNFFLMGPVIVGMPFYVKTHLGGDGSDFAIVEGTYAGGMIVSTWLIARFGARWNPTRMLCWGLIYDGLTYVPLLWVSTVPGTVAVILVHSLGIPTITISRLTALHRLVEGRMQGRVFAYFHLAVMGMTALSIGTVGIVLAWLPVNHLFWIIGLAAAGCGVFGLLHPTLRRA
ncbi:MAG: MFS transporter [Candidatus Lambdaproteobacteria bacterium]|nr:MFS transporter [Candidatus Lambdaproteobacteria bacterium]